MIKYIPLLLSLFVFIPVLISETNAVMYQKLFIQIIGLSISSIYTGIKFPFILKKYSESDVWNFKGVTSIVLFAGSLTFWMIPRSVDLTAQNISINYVMLVNLLLAGYSLGSSLKFMPFVLKTAIIIYGLSMTLTMGMIYYTSKGLLCAVYTIEMQNLAGKYLLEFFPVLFILFLISAARNLRVIAENKTNF